MHIVPDLSIEILINIFNGASTTIGTEENEWHNKVLGGSVTAWRKTRFA